MSANLAKLVSRLTEVKLDGKSLDSWLSEEQQKYDENTSFVIRICACTNKPSCRLSRVYWDPNSWYNENQQMPQGDTDLLPILTTIQDEAIKEHFPEFVQEDVRSVFDSHRGFQKFCCHQPLSQRVDHDLDAVTSICAVQVSGSFRKVGGRSALLTSHVHRLSRVHRGTGLT